MLSVSIELREQNSRLLSHAWVRKYLDTAVTRHYPCQKVPRLMALESERHHLLTVLKIGLELRLRFNLYSLAVRVFTRATSRLGSINFGQNISGCWTGRPPQLSDYYTHVLLDPMIHCSVTTLRLP